LTLDLVSSESSASDASADVPPRDVSHIDAVQEARARPDAPTSDADTCPTCDECTTNDDCASHATKVLCNTNLSLCVACLSDQDCTGDALCDLVRFKCAARCTGDAGECTGSQCDVLDGYCVDCLTDDDCSAPTPRCNHGCVQCLHDADCASLAGTPYCFQNRHLCVECITTSDCSALGPTAACTPKKQCRVPPPLAFD
jgi:hypothetical protein